LSSSIGACIHETCDHSSSDACRLKMATINAVINSVPQPRPTVGPRGWYFH
jgi:hypothetical protein